ncbi:MAG: MaoC family dehydratase N-terminal domain-containing protein [Halioglobus sp.]
MSTTDAGTGAPGAEAQLTIPDYVTPASRRRILELAQPNEKEVSPVECSEYLIRHWLETVEDANPLYNDRQYARSRGFRDIIAQPGMIICTLVMPYGGPWPNFTRPASCCTSR